MSVLVKIGAFSRKYPVTRGMAAYCVIWPISSLCQQRISGKNMKELDFVQAARFSLYGCFFVAPTLRLWVRIAVTFWPQMTITSAITKALVEQVTYGPAAMVSFFFGMSILEGKSISEAVDEVKAKFIPTYKVGVCVWPVLQTINFWLIPERNRVPFVSVCSFVWTSFLAYMKQLETPLSPSASTGEPSYISKK